MVKVIGRSGVELELDEGTAASLVAQGVATYADGEPPAEPNVDDVDEGATSTVPMPAESDTKAAWLAYAVDAHGARFSEANRLTKAELIAQYGQPVQDDDPSDEDSEGDL